MLHVLKTLQESLLLQAEVLELALNLELLRKERLGLLGWPRLTLLAASTRRSGVTSSCCVRSEAVELKLLLMLEVLQRSLLLLLLRERERPCRRSVCAIILVGAGADSGKLAKGVLTQSGGGS